MPPVTVFIVCEFFLGSLADTVFFALEETLWKIHNQMRQLWTPTLGYP